MGVPASMGTVLAIGTQAVNPTGDSYTTVGEVISISDFGLSSAINRYSRLIDGTVRKFKGERDYGDVQLEMGRDLADAGQTALRNAAVSVSNVPYNVRITLNDNPDPSPGDGTPTIFTLKALVTSYNTRIGDNGSFVGATVTLAVTEAPVETAATAGT